MRRITSEARRRIEKINRRRKAGYTWAEIAAELGFNSPGHIVSWINVRALLVDGRYVARDRLAEKPRRAGAAA